jgi:uncharacterized membrane protein
MQWKYITIVVLIVATIILIIYDLIVAITGSWDATISYTVYTLSTQAPILPLAFGILCGHLFAMQRTNASFITKGKAELDKEFNEWYNQIKYTDIRPVDVIKLAWLAGRESVKQELK